MLGRWAVRYPCDTRTVRGNVAHVDGIARGTNRACVGPCRGAENSNVISVLGASDSGGNN